MVLSVVILAAGNGKRMQSSLPKVLHPLGGIPLLSHVVKTAKSLNPHAIYIVHGKNGEQLRTVFDDPTLHWIEQSEPKGTGHALMQVVPFLDAKQRVLILYGDVPLIKKATLQTMLQASTTNQLDLLLTKRDNPFGFGRIIRNSTNDIVAIVEQKDATPTQQAIQEINTGIMSAPCDALKTWLPQLKNQNAQSEFYLTDIVALAVQDQVKVVGSFASCHHEVSGVNDRNELIQLERYYQQQQAQDLLLQGVTILDPQRFDVRGDVQIAKDVTIDINVILEGNVVIDEGASIGPNTLLKNVTIGKNVIIKSNCVIEDATIADECIIGPFARIRPNTHLAERVHVGNFVELKNAQVAAHSKVNHLTYLGDAIVGVGVNVGAGTITCNYDGVNKNTTIIEDGAFIGSGTQLVAPITVREKAYIGAGSTITKDAPEGQLTLARSKQITVKGWKK
jgi:bifunctional UDP-N-acetylglucosamine pyrophosphorylase / glucosamine-1-phosphate N-acetyltransferase